ncbi:DUF262 domain-containing protein [Nocardia sp. NPDC050710]|uniref:DUF262 domain-containing protein n=1 Tax=Nocardia sp. NPDC050710 TaxID=3157220 RepID=UPI0033DAA348
MQQLEAHEKPLGKIFCGDYDFSVPNYQRPYAWARDQVADLLADLTGALGRDENEPYFLGSLVLVKKLGRPEADIIDGQQRLTTLTILFSVLAEMSEALVAEQLRELIVEPGNVLHGLDPKPRIALRPKDKAFFAKYVQQPGRIGALLELGANELVNDAQSAIQANARYLWEELSDRPAEQRLALAKLLVQRTFLVVVSTPDLASAHRIFSVMNARGLDLSPADVFKADVIGDIAEKSRDDYARKWEDAEEELGRADFAELFQHIRMLFDRRRARSELLAEFPKQVLAHFRPGRMHSFVDDELVPLARALCDIRSADYLAPSGDSQAGEAINVWFRRLNQFDNNDWRPVALWALKNHRGDPDFLSKFLARLERLAAAMFIRREYTTPRQERYARLLNELAEGAGLDSPTFELNSREIAETVAMLDGEVYLNSKTRKYVLLRLDELLSAADGPIFRREYITVEHVLPQKPPIGSEWRANFTSAQRAEWTHRLANLVLLNQRKNSRAANFEFQKKKSTYFTGKDGVTTFALTSQLGSIPEWTPAVVEERQKKLLGMLTREWRLEETAGVNGGSAPRPFGLSSRRKGAP